MGGESPFRSIARMRPTRSRASSARARASAALRSSGLGAPRRPLAALAHAASVAASASVGARLRATVQ